MESATNQETAGHNISILKVGSKDIGLIWSIRCSESLEGLAVMQNVW